MPLNLANAKLLCHKTKQKNLKTKIGEKKVHAFLQRKYLCITLGLTVLAFGQV